MNKDVRSPEEKISQALVNLVLDQPFFGSLALRLPVLPDASCETFYTDGRRIGYNPAYVETLNLAEVTGTLAHEVMHCANGHPWRQESREHDQWNEATDYAINPVILEAGMTLPPGILMNPAFEGLGAEVIYPKLPPPQPKGGSGKGQKPGKDASQSPNGCGEVRQDTSPEAAANKAEFEVATLQAAQAAQNMGSLPAGLARLVESIKHPPVDWRSALRRFVQQAARSDYSWRMPNRRYAARGLYLPELRSESMPPIAVAVDTSGSIGPEVLSQFAREVSAIADECRPESVHVIYCDSKVQGSATFEPGEQIKLAPRGGGGTAFGPVFEHLDREGIEPACLVYLTDLYGSFPAQPPAYPVLWACTSAQMAPFGETLRLSGLD